MQSELMKLHGQFSHITNGIQCTIPIVCPVQGSYKKLNLKFKNIQEHFWGENISGASSAHFIYNTINRAISSRETKSLTEVGAVKNVNNGYYRKNRHSVLLRGMLFKG